MGTDGRDPFIALWAQERAVFIAELAFSHEDAIQIMVDEVSRGWRDPELVPLFAEVIVRDNNDVTTSPFASQEAMRISLENMRRELTS